MQAIGEVPLDRDAQPPAGEFADWVLARGPALQRFAYLLSGSRADAQDLVQDALASTFPRWPALSRTDTAEAYVRRAIVNASITAWRKNRRLVAVPDPETRSVVPDHATAQADADLAWRLCAALPPQQRAAVVLRFYEDLSFAQIAGVLDCAEPTARSHVHRAVAALRRALAEHSAENGADHD